MKSFIKRLLLFLLPFFLYLSINAYIDPFNVIYETSNNELVKLKNEISCKLNYPLFKIQAYINNPKKIILLGDSRVNKLKNSYFNNSTSNLAYAGGTLPEITDTFWLVIKNYTISKVYIGINLELMNEKTNMNRIETTKELLESKIKYLFSKDCSTASFYIIKSLIFNTLTDLEKPFLDREKFWQYQLNNTAKQHYKNFYFSNDFVNSLKDISDYCYKNNIELSFIIPPTHIDLQNKINYYSLLNEKKQFRDQLAKLADVYDFNHLNNLTKHRSNFDDPYHFNDSVAKIIANEITTKKIKYARYIQRSTK